MAKIGSPLRNFVHDKKGKLIVGLRLDTGTKTYYTPIKDEQGKNKKKTFGRDLEKAIQKFEHWQNQDDELELMNRITYMEMDGHWDYFKDKLLNDGAYAAKKLDMPCFADPDFLKDYRPKNVCRQQKWHKNSSFLRELFRLHYGHFTINFFSFNHCFTLQIGSAF